MALFVIVCKDKPGALETRLATRPVHLDYLNASGLVKAAGPLRWTTPETRSARCADHRGRGSGAPHQALADNDPYAAAGVFEARRGRSPARSGVGSL
ncbi:YciI family protein [Caulobacter segnis]